MERHKHKEKKNFRFCLTEADCIGWDLDHTLVRYNIKEFNQLIFRSFKKYLVEIANYNPKVMDFQFDSDFTKKGLVIDKKRGNILKVDKDSRIMIGYHGSKKLSDENLKTIYGERKQTDFSGTNNSTFWSLSTYFESACVSLYRDLIDLADENKGHAENVNVYNRDYSSHGEAIYNSMSYNFGQWEKGWYFSEIATYPEKYLRKQPGVRKWLEDLRKVHGKLLFLLTNSLSEYTNVLMTYCYGSDWTKLFDIISVHAKKTSLFYWNVSILQCNYGTKREKRISWS